MFSPDIITLRQFYTTPLGMAMCRAISEGIASLWPAAKGDSILGIGYASPYLELYLDDTDVAIVCMPAYQGAAYWPVGGGNRVFLAHESALPLPANSINRILMIHSIESSEQLSWMMDEVWRVLTPEGRVLAVVPNRLGLLSHFANNPFGSGRPFSKAQMKELMSNHGLTMLCAASACFMPPLNYPIIYRVANWFEKTGRWLYPLLGGVLLVEAEKQVYASIHQPVLARKGQPVPIRAAKPVMGLKQGK